MSPNLDQKQELGSKAGNFLSGKRENGERGRERDRLGLGPNLEWSQGISCLEREMEREIG